MCNFMNDKLCMMALSIFDYSIDLNDHNVCTYACMYVIGYKLGQFHLVDVQVDVAADNDNIITLSNRYR